MDRQLDVENREYSPGERREQMKVLAGLEVTAKSVERKAEAIGANIAAREQREIRKPSN